MVWEKIFGIQSILFCLYSSFIAISNWVTIQYRLVLEYAPILNSVFSNLWTFLITAVIVFSIVSVLGGHFIHRKRQFRIEQELATDENPYL